MSDFIAPDRYGTDAFLLRSYQVGDGPALRAVVSSSYEHLKTYMHWATPDQTEDQAEKLVRRLSGRYLLGEDFTLGIFAPDESELLGGTGYHLRSGPPSWHNAEIGMWIRADRARQGLGTQVLKALLAWGFSAWPWQRLSWHCDVRNLSSNRVAEKAGLVREGVLRSQQLLRDGSRRDTAVYAALRPVE